MRIRIMSYPARALTTFLLTLMAAPFANAARGPAPVFAVSASDRALTTRLVALSPSVDVNEARQVAYVAYTTGRELAREWQVVWPPGYQNFLVHQGKRKGGLCFQWAAELLARLDALKPRSLELHWAESFAGTFSEHNVIVVTAKDQPFARGILLDNWRYSGRLIWGPVYGDPHYEWTENRPELIRRLQRTAIAAGVPHRSATRP